eukprot:TRINITY_DN18300_c0_g1_i1.p1 TRINITY_DN18300_c0_g1~~TRINITY_DN18300_c0_g1_i1.p1  ORF type:complete len:372 (+),score=39.47 TRINITY_DN18300_c0_g1_i1:133-1248(+)
MSRTAETIMDFSSPMDTDSRHRDPLNCSIETVHMLEPKPDPDDGPAPEHVELLRSFIFRNRSFEDIVGTKHQSQLPPRPPLPSRFENELPPFQTPIGRNCGVPPLPSYPLPSLSATGALFGLAGAPTGQEIAMLPLPQLNSWLPNSTVPVVHHQYSTALSPRQPPPLSSQPLPSLHPERKKKAESRVGPILFRNLFHQVTCGISDKLGNFEGWRVYVCDDVGYSGNARRFKKHAELGEKALLLTCALLHPDRNEALMQCVGCKDYFENQQYFKSSPHCIGKILLIKNNTVIKVKDGQFSVTMKLMCCCAHHEVRAFRLYLALTDTRTGSLVLSSTTPVYVKQWRKSNQPVERIDVDLALPVELPPPVHISF